MVNNLCVKGHNKHNAHTHTHNPVHESPSWEALTDARNNRPPRQNARSVLVCSSECAHPNVYCMVLRARVSFLWLCLVFWLPYVRVCTTTMWRTTNNDAQTCREQQTTRTNTRTYSRTKPSVSCLHAPYMYPSDFTTKQNAFDASLRRRRRRKRERSPRMKEKRMERTPPPR